MKRQAAALVLLLSLVFGGTWLVLHRRAASLPRIPLRGGGEFRVVQVSYGQAKEHHLGGAPRPIVWLWDRLPTPAKRVIPEPSRGETVLVPGAKANGLSIYWASIDSATHKPETGPSGDVIMTTEFGEERNLGWPDAFEDPSGGGFRQIYVDEPPRNSSKLRFRVPVEREAVEFTIDNPAYRR